MSLRFLFYKEGAWDQCYQLVSTYFISQTEQWFNDSVKGKNWIDHFRDNQIRHSVSVTNYLFGHKIANKFGNTATEFKLVQ